jgi:hypothetical protein
MAAFGDERAQSEYNRVIQYATVLDNQLGRDLTQHFRTSVTENNFMNNRDLFETIMSDLRRRGRRRRRGGGRDSRRGRRRRGN